MAKAKIEINEEAVEERVNPMLAAARKVLLAGIGAVALAQEEIEDFVNRLVERGEIAEKDGRKLVNDVMEKRKKQVEEQVDKGREQAEESLDTNIERVLHRMNVPTKKDIDELSQKITALTKKVDELKKSEQKSE
jgi:poly(hydroxyalkanoate) granule-associated protein